MAFPSRSARARAPLLPVAGLVILLIAGLGVLNLFLLLRVYHRAARSLASVSALEYGLLATRQLAAQPLLRDTAPASGDLASFGRVVDALQALEPGLEFVSVTERGAVVFHRQPSLEVRPPTPDADLSVVATNPPPPIRVGRQAVGSGSNRVPVLTFSRAFQAPGRPPRQLQVALRRDLFEREHAGTAQAVTAMFTLSVATLAGSFGLCLLAIAGLIRRELTWQKRQRLNDHLAVAGALAGSLLHDFRNPMSAMRLDAQLLQQEAARGAASRTERLAALAGRVVRTLDRLDALLGEFLAVTKPGQAAPERFDLPACVLDCLDLVQHRFARARVRLTLHPAPGPVAVVGAPLAIKRALLNILHNAEQFSPPDGTVTVAVRRADGAAEICVDDEGPGIAPADRRRLFELFFSRRPGGTGLGLALAKTAVEHGGGAIAAGTPPSGKGSRFVIRLPLADG